MKKLIIILSIVLTLALAGLLYGTQGKSDEGETVTLDQVYMNHCLDPMPEVVLDPMTGFPLY